MADGDDNDAGGEKFGLFFLMGRHILILLCHKDSTSMRHFPFSTSRLYILGTLSGNGLDSGSVVSGGGLGGNSAHKSWKAQMLL